MNKNGTHTQLHLFDDPKSQIRFLELSLGEQEWRASIHLPDGFGDGKALMHELKSKGFHVRQSKDADGYTQLHLHHLGAAPDVIGLFRDYGLIHGAGYSIQNPLISSKALLNGMAGSLREAGNYIKDPARANGIIYLTAEAFLVTAASGNPHGKWHTPKNFLQGLSAMLFLSQSAAYLGWAKKGDDRIIADFKKQTKLDEDSLLGKLPAARALNERPTKNPLDHAKRALEDHPIQTGAILNNLGMVAYIGHAILERRHRKDLLKINPNDERALRYINKGFWQGVAGSVISIIGWSSLIPRPKETEEPSNNPFIRLYEKWRANPQTLAAGTTLASSSLRLMDALNKGNKIQAIGEGIYIPGDVLLFFVKNHEYGASTQQNIEALAEKVSHVILARPQLLSPAKQEEMVSGTADYLVKQLNALSDKLKGDAPALSEQKEQMHEALAKEIRQEMTTRFDLLISSASRLISAFPPNKQTAVANLLASEIPKLSGVHATPEEITACLCDVKAVAEHAMTTQQLSEKLADVVSSIPGPHAGDNLLRLYKALAPLCAEQDPQKTPDKNVSTTELSRHSPIIEKQSLNSSQFSVHSI